MSDEWYYALNDSEYGPVTLAQLGQLVASGAIRPTDLSWHKTYGRGRERCVYVVANLLEDPPAAEDGRLLSVIVRGRASGTGVSTGNWHDTCAAQQESVYWSLAALTAQIVRDQPDAHEPLFALAACYFDLGLLYQSAGRLRGAGWAFDEALTVRERLARSWPHNPEYQQALAASFNQRGLLDQQLGRLDDTETAITKAVRSAVSCCKSTRTTPGPACYSVVPFATRAAS